jgi:hypothetical protein
MDYRLRLSVVRGASEIARSETELQHQQRGYKSRKATKHQQEV